MRAHPAALTALLLCSAAACPAHAQTRAETLRQVAGGMVNTLDPTMPGSTREAFGVSMGTYDRLVTWDRKPRANGYIFDYDHMHGELADSYNVSPDGLTLTFHLRPGAKWHDGSPVTVEDVKWSLDREVTAKSLAGPQLQTGSLTKADQFKIVDEHTISVTLDRPDRLALPNLGTVYAIMINSKLARQHATSEDPWAQQWLSEHEAGGGAYAVESFKPGEQVILRRNEDWANGPKPFFRRVIQQTVPEPATRANLVERGDADIAIDLQASDVIALEQRGRVKIVSTPQFNAFTMITFNLRLKPFDNVKVRRAIAAALPYEDMFQAGIFGRGAKLFGGDWTEQPPDGKFPQPMPLHTDLAAAKRLLTEAGFPGRLQHEFQLQCRVGRGQRAGVCAGQGIARQDRRHRRYPEIAGRPDQHPGHQKGAAFLHRELDRLAALDRLLLPQFLHRRSALELQRVGRCGRERHRAKGPVRTGPRRV